MHRGTVLLVGIVCLAALMYFAATVVAPRIEADIGDETARVLASAGKDFVEVGVDGRDVTVTGAAPSDADREEVVALAKDLPGVRLVRDEMTVLDPPVSPFTFSATLDDEGVSLTGFVPDEETKTALFEKAQSLFGDAVKDDTIIARGVPDENWRQAVSAGLDQLAAMSFGELAVEDTTLALSGTLAMEENAGAVEGALIAALPPSYAFQPGFEVASSAPAEETGATVEGIVGGVEEGAQAAVSALNLESSEDAEQASDALGSEAAVPSVLPALDTPEACQAEFDGLLAQQTIQFSSASAVISVDSYDLLNQLGDTADRCAEALIAIEGHTDSTGPLQGNIDLSLARAEAVMEYLVGLGIDRARLSAFGYGPTLPVASNDTEEGRAQNRRIEFKVER